MSLASLEAFLERAVDDEPLRELLRTAPDAAAVAAIARAAGYPVSERDLWQASGAGPAELHATGVEPASSASAPAATPAAPLPDPWLEDDPLSRFVQQAHGDEELQRSLATAPDAAAVAAIAQAAGYPISEVDLWLASGVTPEEVAVGETSTGNAEDDREAEAPEMASEDDGIGRFLRQAESDPALRQALASAEDAAAVAAIAQQAGHPISELDLWLASEAAFEEARKEREVPDPVRDPLADFLRAIELDADLQMALASAPDAATVAAIARLAGFPITTADLWASSDADPHELMPEEVWVETMLMLVDG